jgi:DNA-directed RNA polymerase specialized sigma24 family protein
VLVLRYWEDLAEADVARILGCSVGSVKSQASRGLHRLRAVLAPDEATEQEGTRS